MATCIDLPEQKVLGRIWLVFVVTSFAQLLFRWRILVQEISCPHLCNKFATSLLPVIPFIVILSAMALGEFSFFINSHYLLTKFYELKTSFQL